MITTNKIEFQDKELSQVTRDVHEATDKIYEIMNKCLGKYDNTLDKILFKHRVANCVWWQMNETIVQAIHHQTHQLNEMEKSRPIKPEPEVKP